VTVRDRNTMGQIRVAASELRTVMEKLLDGRWDEIHRQHAFGQ